MAVTFSWKDEILSLAMLAGMMVMAVLAWPIAPDRIPVHWNLSGTADRFGGKLEGLALPPLIATALYLYMLFSPRVDRRRAGQDASGRRNVFVRTGVVALILVLYGIMLRAVL